MKPSRNPRGRLKAVTTSDLIAALGGSRCGHEPIRAAVGDAVMVPNCALSLFTEPGVLRLLARTAALRGRHWSDA